MGGGYGDKNVGLFNSWSRKRSHTCSRREYERRMEGGRDECKRRKGGHIAVLLQGHDRTSHTHTPFSERRPSFSFLLAFSFSFLPSNGSLLVLPALSRG